MAALSLPEGSQLVSVMRHGTAHIASAETVIRPGDQVVAILEPGLEDCVRRALAG